MHNMESAEIHVSKDPKVTSQDPAHGTVVSSSSSRVSKTRNNKKTLKFDHDGKKFQKRLTPDDFSAVVKMVQTKANLSLPNDCYLMIGDNIVTDDGSFRDSLATQSEKRVAVIVKVCDMFFNLS